MDRETLNYSLDKSLVESQYGKMELDREIYLERARRLAELNNTTFIST